MTSVILINLMRNKDEYNLFTKVFCYCVLMEKYITKWCLISYGYPQCKVFSI